jgi:hypothetical protein
VTATDGFHKNKVVELRTTGGSLKGKLLSSLVFHRNVWVTLLMFLNVGSLFKIGSSHAGSRDENFERMKVRNFFTIL